MWPILYRNGGAVQTTTGLSGPDAVASSLANSAGVTESFPHGHPDEAEPDGSTPQASVSRRNRVDATRRVGSRSFMTSMITAGRRAVRAGSFPRWRECAAELVGERSESRAGAASVRSVYSRTSSPSRIFSTAVTLRRMRRAAASTSRTTTSIVVADGKRLLEVAAARHAGLARRDETVDTRLELDERAELRHSRDAAARTWPAS